MKWMVCIMKNVKILNIENEMNELKKLKINLIRPKNIAKLFHVDDKLIRRHLRKNFAKNHEHNNPWIWSMDDEQLHEIISYFKSKYKIQN